MPWSHILVDKIKLVNKPKDVSRETSFLYVYNYLMNNKKFSIISIFTALIIILQLLSTYINFGGFPITLTLVPIIVAGAVLGPQIGALMGLVFGTVVSIMVILGLDQSGAIMFASHPIITVLTCVIKGMLAGLIGAFVYKKIANKKTAIIISSIITPIINTATLYISLILFFDSSFAAMVAAFMSINFFIELIINVLLAPGLINVINRAKNREHF